MRKILRLAMISASLALAASAWGQVDGGFIEQDGTTVNTRDAHLTSAEIAAIMPSRGAFAMPSPWDAEAIRITNESDCGGGGDCVQPATYGYWMQTNNHVGQDTMYILVGLSKGAGGGGPTLFEYDKTDDSVTNQGAIFASDSNYSNYSTEGWYWSASEPNQFYVKTSTRLRRYDVSGSTFETVFDITEHSGHETDIIWQNSSSDDDNVHAFTIRDSSYSDRGCGVYVEDADEFTFYPKVGSFDECQIDPSGTYLVIKEDIDGVDGEDNRIITIATGEERQMVDREGAAGHSDLGYSYMLFQDNYANDANTHKVVDFTQSTLTAETVYQRDNWSIYTPQHISHNNAVATSTTAMADQYACGANNDGDTGQWSNEIVCFMLDSSDSDVLVVAPSLAVNTASSHSSYYRMPKGYLDITGQYFLWTANHGTSRMDLFMVKIPYSLLGASASSVEEPTASTPPSGESEPTPTTPDADESSGLELEVFPGGIVEQDQSGSGRAIPTANEIAGFVPDRGLFTFPDPWGTSGVRLTNDNDCGGTSSDCVESVGESHWRNINNHAGSDMMLIVLGLDKAEGGGGPTLFEYNKTTDEVSNEGALFASASPFSDESVSGWYWSRTNPYTLYLTVDSRLLRFNVITDQFETVFDISGESGHGTDLVISAHSSDDDNVHSMDVTDSLGTETGCAYYVEDTNTFTYVAESASGSYNQCRVDHSGNYVVMLDDTDADGGEDARVITVVDGSETVMLDTDSDTGAPGNFALGWEYMVYFDNQDADANTVKRVDLSDDPIVATTTFQKTNWDVNVAREISHTNAVSTASKGTEDQYVCASDASNDVDYWTNEIICWMVGDITDDPYVLVVAPTMTDVDAAGGGATDYEQRPKGNLDVTGRYFIWTSNMGGARQDAFLVKVPYHHISPEDFDAEDSDPPETYDVGSDNLLSTTATITWATNERADTRLEYATDAVFSDAQIVNRPYNAFHTVELSGLEPATTYYYRIITRDSRGNLSISGTQTFTTSE